MSSGNNEFGAPAGYRATRELDAPLVLSPIDVDERIGRALVSAIFLKYGSLDAGTYASAVEMRAAVSRNMQDTDELGTSLAYVQAIAQTYAWSPYDLRPDDGLQVLKPDDRDPDRHGRWVAAPFRDHRGAYYWHGLEVVGFVDKAIPLEAPRGRPSLLTLAKGKTPAVFVSFDGKDRPVVQDAEPGAILEHTLNFTLRVISKNWRGTPSARFGSGISEEAALDPGASAIVGRLEWLLRGSQGLYGAVPGGGYSGALGMDTSPWTDFCRVIIGAHSTSDTFGQDLRLMDSLAISVRVSTDRPSEIQDLNRRNAFAVQQTQVQSDGSACPIGPPQILFARKDRRP